jgi:hypothetical protein
VQRCQLLTDQDMPRGRKDGHRHAALRPGVPHCGIHVAAQGMKQNYLKKGHFYDVTLPRSRRRSGIAALRHAPVKILEGKD